MLKTEQLRLLIEHGEDGKVERKRELRIKEPPDKAEFIRDILALSNSHEHRTAHMLIGVANDGSLHDIGNLGLADAQLQELVGAYVEAPLRFTFSTHVIDEVTLGMLSIPVSEWRFHVVKKELKENDKTLLTRGETWIRRGSSKGRPTAWDYQLLKEDAILRRDERGTLQRQLAVLESLSADVTYNLEVIPTDMPHGMYRFDHGFLREYPADLRFVPPEIVQTLRNARRHMHRYNALQPKQDSGSPFFKDPFDNATTELSKASRLLADEIRRMGEEIGDLAQDGGTH